MRTIWIYFASSRYLLDVRRFPKMLKIAEDACFESGPANQESIYTWSTNLRRIFSGVQWACLNLKD
jgi:hypothetical protein